MRSIISIPSIHTAVTEVLNNTSSKREERKNDPNYGDDDNNNNKPVQVQLENNDTTDEDEEEDYYEEEVIDDDEEDEVEIEMDADNHNNNDKQDDELTTEHDDTTTAYEEVTVADDDATYDDEEFTDDEEIVELSEDDDDIIDDEDDRTNSERIVLDESMCGSAVYYKDDSSCPCGVSVASSVPVFDEELDPSQLELHESAFLEGTKKAMMEQLEREKVLQEQQMRSQEIIMNLQTSDRQLDPETLMDEEDSTEQQKERDRAAKNRLLEEIRRIDKAVSNNQEAILRSGKPPTHNLIDQERKNKALTALRRQTAREQLARKNNRLKAVQASRHDSEGSDMILPESIMSSPRISLESPIVDTSGLADKSPGNLANLLYTTDQSSRLYVDVSSTMVAQKDKEKVNDDDNNDINSICNEKNDNIVESKPESVRDKPYLSFRKNVSDSQQKEISVEDKTNGKDLKVQLSMHRNDKNKEIQKEETQSIDSGENEIDSIVSSFPVKQDDRKLLDSNDTIKNSCSEHSVASHSKAEDSITSIEDNISLVGSDGNPKEKTPSVIENGRNYRHQGENTRRLIQNFESPQRLSNFLAQKNSTFMSSKSGTVSVPALFLNTSRSVVSKVSTSTTLTSPTKNGIRRSMVAVPDIFLNRPAANKQEESVSDTRSPTRTFSPRKRTIPPPENIPSMFQSAFQTAAPTTESKELRDADWVDDIDDSIGEYHPIADIQEGKVQGIDMAHREQYLSPSEFLLHFQMTKKEFLKLPKWKRDKAKRALKLF